MPRSTTTTRTRACLNATRRFANWCDTRGIGELPDGEGLPRRRETGALTGNAMWHQDAYRMIPRPAVAAGIKMKIGNYTCRATGITA